MPTTMKTAPASLYTMHGYPVQAVRIGDRLHHAPLVAMGTAMGLPFWMRQSDVPVDDPEVIHVRDLGDALVFTGDHGEIGILLPTTWEGPRIAASDWNGVLTWCGTLVEAQRAWDHDLNPPRHGVTFALTPFDYVHETLSEPMRRIIVDRPDADQLLARR